MDFSGVLDAFCTRIRCLNIFRFYFKQFKKFQFFDILPNFHEFMKNFKKLKFFKLLKIESEYV